MHLNELQTACLRTMRPYSPLPSALNWALGLTSEAGEVATMIKHHYFHGKTLDQIALCEELGDILWYVSTMAAAFGFTLEDVAQANIEKLRARYPNGFSPEASMSRNLEAEREVLDRLLAERVENGANKPSP